MGSARAGKMRVAVVGSGVAGLTAARTLAQSGANVVLYEKDSHIGGHANTLHVDGVALDIGFMVFNQVTYPNMVAFFDEIGVEMEKSDMSFAVSLDGGKGCEWGSKSVGGLFAQRSNAVNPFFWNMIREMLKFKADVLAFLARIESGDPGIDEATTLGDFLTSHGYSQKFKECYLIPVCASIWSCSSLTVLGFSAVSILTFCRNHHLLQLFGRPQWITVKGRSETYVSKVVDELQERGAEIRAATAVTRIESLDDGRVRVEDERGGNEIFDECIVAAHAPDALEMRGEYATSNEKKILGAFQYAYSDIYVHRDENFMPRNKAAWAAWNFLGDINNRCCVTYWLNLLQNLGDTGLPFLVTLNPAKKPERVVSLWRTSHPIPSPEAADASKRLGSIQGHRGVWYCGAYQGYGFHEDGFKAGLVAAKQLLGQKAEVLRNVKQMVPSWTEYSAQQAVVAVLHKFIRTGQLQILEAGGSILDFIGSEKGCSLKVSIRVNSPQFYWKIATRADIGLADAYVDGDFSIVGDKNGLLHFLQLIIANRDINRSEVVKQTRGWWNPVFVTAAVGGAVSFLRHKLRGNSLTNARRNISRHYDLSNELFALFLDDTMTYSSAIFKGPNDTLKDAQLRKLHLMIQKAKIEPHHEVLEIGFGWGSMAIELVRRTGCNYTGITLSKEQLAFATDRVKQEGLEDKITFKLCDYRSLEGHHKFNRIISCEMLEAVGHEYYKEFFSRCDYLLAKDGLIVLQVITIPDERYDEYLKSSDFIKEYIFPGGSLPCISALTSAMAAGSTLSLEHLENIGLHYFQTLMCWRENFLAKASECRKLGFSDKFIRMWDYYFIYCAAGFQTCTLGNLQLVFSRPGNVAAVGNPYVSFPMGLASDSSLEAFLECRKKL
ncbi:hypothetical protein Mp_7g04870 [Marchantia polymorpha subsp. ruderalis]|uniref:Amine oxidase domain-containing protein n=2 Tax=Marchantia polymorpha TaxID=3197 RepID=A0AAF6BW84_MARPO|nr:hypothetical protein MARPO_0062s0039 [Marchantia polymorpha]BBN16268.1 hypothetical protein Mp_7g04870 [Marchantia polymorpha subsp. ruderalis]|eukprot:PTQ36614.1 hypothetical protein MARPO_0062s0039 [Marchantia polymorpha]